MQKKDLIVHAVGVNALRRAKKEVAENILPQLIQFEGKDIYKMDGSLLQKVRDKLTLIRPDVEPKQNGYSVRLHECGFDCSSYHLRIRLRVTVQDGEITNYYGEPFTVASVEKGTLEKVYTLEEVVNINDLNDEATPETMQSQIAEYRKLKDQLREVERAFAGKREWLTNA